MSVITYAYNLSIRGRQLTSYKKTLSQNEKDICKCVYVNEALVKKV